MSITQEVNIEMLEKLPDGNYKKKNPQTKASQVIANNGQTVEQHLADDNAIKHKAKTIALEDASNKFTATNVEGAMTELFTNVSDGKTLVGSAITGVDNSIVIPTNPSFGDLASAIGGISTRKKCASGVINSSGTGINFVYASGSGNSMYHLTVTGLDFVPREIKIWGIPGAGSTICYPQKLTNTEGRIISIRNMDYYGATNTEVKTYKLDGDSAYLTNGGFRMPVAFGNHSYNYEAVE